MYPLGLTMTPEPRLCRALRLLFQTVPEKMPEQRIVEERMARRLDLLAGENIHDCGDGLSHRVAVRGRARGHAR